MTIELQARQLGCVRGRRQLFADIGLGLAPGRALRVAGVNGSGKSSLLRILCGLAAPQSGAVLWRGADIRSSRAEFARELLYLGHEAAIKEDFSAIENLVAGAALSGAPVSIAQARGALAVGGLLALADTPCRHLSEGQRKRVALARLHMARERRLWVLDEPFSALDAHAVKVLTGTLDAHVAGGGMLVYTTHQDIALRAADSLTLSAAW